MTDAGRPTEAELVRRARDGERDAFRTVVELHQERVYALALRLTGHDVEAMDLTQEVFVEAWGALGRFRQDSRVDSWLHGITIRLARQRWRKQRRRSEREARYVRENFEEAVIRSMPDAAIDLERALADLPPRMRMALVLHCIEGLPQREVARLMGVAEGTVKAHVHGARKMLEERLKR